MTFDYEAIGLAVNAYMAQIAKINGVTSASQNFNVF